MSPYVIYPLLFLLGVLACWLFVYIKRDPIASPLDLICTPEGKLSAAKIGQLIGVVISSWVVISMTSAGKLTYDIFLIYLTYTAGVDLFGKWLRSREDKSNPPDKDDAPKEGE